MFFPMENPGSSGRNKRGPLPLLFLKKWFFLAPQRILQP
jgi:hypothetical protein